MHLGSLLVRAGRSFYDPSAYREAVRDRTASCVAGLALVVAATWIADTYMIRAQLRKLVTALELETAEMPALHLENGEARLDPPGPFVIELEGKPFVILDPEMSAEEALTRGEGVFVTRTHVFLQRTGRADSRNYALSALGDRVIQGSDLARWGETFVELFPFVFYPLAVAFLVAWRIWIAVGCAVIMYPIARVVGAELDFAARFRLASLALVPTLVIDAVATLSLGKNGWTTWMGVVCSLAFLTFGIVANRRTASPASSDSSRASAA